MGPYPQDLMAPPPNTIDLGIRFPTHEFWGIYSNQSTNFQSIYVHLVFGNKIMKIKIPLYIDGTITILKFPYI